MKTSFFFILAIALAFTACQTDDEIILPRTSATIADIELDDQSLAAGNCKNITTDHALTGKGTWDVLDVDANDVYESVYFVSAAGPGWLGESEGRSELELIYDHQNRVFQGTLTSQFAGAEMIHRFQGRAAFEFDDAPDEVKDPVIVGETDLVTGIMKTAFGEYQLNEGALLKIVVGPNPEGLIDVAISIDGLYCNRDKVFTGRK